MLKDPTAILAKVRQNAFLAMLAGYVTVLLAWYLYHGVLFQFSLGVFFLALLPVTLIIGRTTQLVRELTPFLVLLLSYEALQGIAGSLLSDPTTQPITHSGLFVGAVQATFYSPALTDVASVFYGLHFPLVVVSAVILWYSNKFLYKRYVYSLLACSYVSLLFYVLMPSAPPWYTGVASNLLDTGVVQQGPWNLFSALDSVGELIESDKLAAFPSLHAAYVVLFCYFTLRLKRSYGVISVPVTVGVLFSTIYLGQHFIIDLVAGAAVAGACVLLVSRVLEHRRAEQRASLGTRSEILQR